MVVNVQPKKTVDLKDATKGLGYGIQAYLIWGIFPVYFKALSGVPPLQVVCHRIVWSVLFLWIIIFWRDQWRPILRWSWFVRQPEG